MPKIKKSKKQDLKEYKKIMDIVNSAHKAAIEFMTVNFEKKSSDKLAI